MEEEQANTPPVSGDTNLPAPPPPVRSAQGMTENTWAMIVHLSALVGFLIPFGNVLGPLVIWVIKKDELPEVDRHGKEALNYHISISIYLAVAWAITLVLTLVFIGILLVPVVAIANIILMALFPVLAGVKANEGGWYDYPMTIRFIN